MRYFSFQHKGPAFFQAKIHLFLQLSKELYSQICISPKKIAQKRQLKKRLSLTESFAMIPDASICGFIFAHPEASYPDILRLRGKSIEAYAVRRGLPSALAHSLLSHLGEGE